jgi:hypothetical protein
MKSVTLKINHFEASHTRDNIKQEISRTATEFDRHSKKIINVTDNG